MFKQLRQIWRLYLRYRIVHMSETKDLKGISMRTERSVATNCFAQPITFAWSPLAGWSRMTRLRPVVYTRGIFRKTERIACVELRGVPTVYRKSTGGLCRRILVIMQSRSGTPLQVLGGAF